MIIDLRQVALTYQSPDGELEALRDISFSMEDGEFVSIVGPSGCGKSTLLSLIAGLEKPDRGDIAVDGEAVTAPSPKIGFMPQRDQLFEWRSIWSNVTLGLEIRRQNTPERQAGSCWSGTVWRALRANGPPSSPAECGSAAR